MKLSCHTGFSRMLSLIKKHFWWPSMDQDIQEFKAACSTCARNKQGNQPPAGLLQPQPTSMDFTTEILPSESNTVILTVIDEFSKAVHFIPLPKLPSAFETAQVLVQNVFRIHGIPSDVVSDWGPQFISQVWHNFCKTLGASSSLTSEYHPQSNGQAECCNQELETTLRCVTESNPSVWIQHLVWVEYAHNVHTLVVTVCLHLK